VKRRRKKKKKKEQDEEAPPPEEAAPPPPPEPKKEKSSKKKSSKKKSSKRATSGAFSLFTDDMMVTFKKGFDYIDCDKNGIIDREDIRRCFDLLGKIASDKDLDDLMDDPCITAPITFTMFLTMFGEKMGAAGGEADSDKKIKFAFKCIETDNSGGIDPIQMDDYLTGWGVPFTPAEVKLIFPQLPLLGEDAPEPKYADWISVSAITQMLTGAEDDEATATESQSEG